MHNVTPPSGRYIGINWASVWNSGVGDLRFWLIPVLGQLALGFLITDTSISVLYLTKHSTFADKGLIYGFVGVFLALCVGFFSHIGIHKSITTLPGRILKTLGVLTTLCIVAVSYWFAVSFFDASWQEDLQKETEMATHASGLRDVAEAERSTDAESAAVNRAEQALVDATRRRNEAEALRVELAALPSAVWNERVAEIQSIIGTTPDGLKYNLTTTAMNSFAEQAREDEIRADQAYQSALATLTAKQGRLVVAVENELTAALVETEQTYWRSMRTKAEENLGLTFVPDPETDEQRDANEQILALGEVYAKRRGQVQAGLVTLLSCFLGLFRFLIKDPKVEDDDFVVHHRGNAIDQKGLPAPDAFANDERPRYRGRSYIADDAPLQPGESPGAASERLARARRAYEMEIGYSDDDDDLDDLDLRAARAMERIAKENERKRRLAEVMKLEKEAEDAAAAARAPARPPRQENRDDLYGPAPSPSLEPEVAARQRGYDPNAFVDLDTEYRNLEDEYHRLEAEDEDIRQRVVVASGVQRSRGLTRQRQIQTRMQAIFARLQEIKEIQSPHANSGFHG